MNKNVQKCNRITDEAIHANKLATLTLSLVKVRFAKYCTSVRKIDGTRSQNTKVDPVYRFWRIECERGREDKRSPLVGGESDALVLGLNPHSCYIK